VGGTFRRNDEVDELQWVNFGSAARILSYEQDRELLAFFRAARKGA
jgi:hypothetical protein